MTSATTAISVVLVHTADEPVTPETIAGVDADASEIVVVNCTASRDDLAKAVFRRGVTVIDVGPSTELAEARNLGSGRTTGDVIAFFSAAARPQPGWRDAVVEGFEAGLAVACLAPSVDGLAPAPVTFDGHPVGTGPSMAATPADVLYPPSEALFVRARTFHEVQGFDANLERFGEEVELGWRLWFLGFKVRTCPRAVITIDRRQEHVVASERRLFLRERNGLRMVFTYYDGGRQPVALAAAEALTGLRGEVEEQPDVAGEAVDAFTAGVGGLRLERARLQAHRRRTDPELLALFGAVLEPSGADRRLVEGHGAVVETFGLHDRLAGRRRIVILTPDVLDAKMAGPAIRAWHIATALAVEHEVQLVTTNPSCRLSPTTFTARSVDDSELRELEAWCDVLVVQGFVFPGRPFLPASKKVIVVDLYDPIHLEQLELSKGDPDGDRRAMIRGSTAMLNEQLLRGDFFICASAKQRDFWLGQLAGLGRVNPLTYDESVTLESLVAVVPFGLPEEPPRLTRHSLKGVVPGIAEDDEVILWGGGIYNWFDPLTLLRAVDRLRQRRPKVRLFFMGLRHPNPEVLEMRMAVAARALSDELGLTGTYVFFNEGWVEYDARQNYLLEADIGVSTHLDHLETAFSFRTRILDYIWAALPIVATVGDALADMIERESLGLTVPAEQVEELEEALFRLLADAELRALCRKRLESLRGRFAWTDVLQPLVDFCLAPRRAPDLVDSEMAAHLHPTDDRAGNEPVRRPVPAGPERLRPPRQAGTLTIRGVVGKAMRRAEAWAEARRSAR